MTLWNIIRHIAEKNGDIIYWDENPETRVFCQWFLGCVQVNPFSMKSDCLKMWNCPGC